MSIEYKEPMLDVTPGGRIRFFKGLGLDRGYSNSIFFATKTEQESFFATQASNEITYSNGTKSAPTMVIKSPFVRTFRVPANSAEIFPFDYIEVTPSASSSGAMAKKLYMFIIGVSFVNENVALIECELDVIQTFMFDWKLGTQAVEQMHSRTVNSRYDDELKNAENFNPGATEVFKSETIVEAQTNSEGYMVAVTEALRDKLPATNDDQYWFGWSATYDTYVSAPVNEKDGNQLIYLYVKDGEQLFKLLSIYETYDRLSAVKQVKACPPLTMGNAPTKWVGTKQNFEPGLSGAELRVSGKRYATYSSACPSEMLGYTPKDPKTYTLINLKVSTASGDNFVLTTEDINTSRIDIKLCGVGGLNPEILIYPAVGDVPAIANQDGSVKSYNAPVISINTFANYTTFNKDQQDLFEQQYQSTLFSNMVGLFTKIAGIGMGG